MSLLIASLEIDQLKEEQNRIIRNAKGESGSGIVSARISTEDINELAEVVKKCDKEAQQQPLAATSKVVYAQAMVRDALYAIQGRKFMRAMSLNTRRGILYNRAYAIEETKQKPK